MSGNLLPGAGLSINNLLRLSRSYLKGQCMFKFQSFRYSFLAALALLSGVRTAASTTITESFSADPFQHGWRIFGDTNLFAWDPTNQNLRVTWDSSQSNSFFYMPLGTVLSRSDDFTFAFDLRLTDIGPGPDPNKNTSFPICIELLDIDRAAKTNFIRGTGTDSPDLAEMAYFWDSGFGATTWPTFVDTNSSFNYNGASDYALYALTLGDTYRFVISYTASNQIALTTVTNLSNSSGIVLTQLLNSAFADYRLASVSVSSYSDAGQDPAYAGSVLSHGIVDDISVTVPPPPVQNLSGGWTNNVWSTAFTARTNWLYALERSVDLQKWEIISSNNPGVDGQLVLTAPSTNSAALYRLRASRP